jgi:hypothetical protein
MDAFLRKVMQLTYYVCVGVMFQIFNGDSMTGAQYKLPIAPKCFGWHSAPPQKQQFTWLDTFQFM